MKKIVLALLVVLLLGTFVACDGEADFLLWDSSTSKSLTLNINQAVATIRHVSFDSDDETALVKTFNNIPDSVTTWQDLIDLGYEIPVYSNDPGYPDNPYYLMCEKVEYYTPNRVEFNSGIFSLSLTVNVNNGAVSPGDPIDFSATYTLGIDD